MKSIKNRLGILFISLLIYGCNSTNNISTIPAPVSPKPSISSPEIVNTPSVPPTDNNLVKINNNRLETLLPESKRNELLRKLHGNIVYNNSDIYIREDGTGLLVFDYTARKIDNFKISEQDIVFYNSSKEISVPTRSEPKLVINNNGDGFILFTTGGGICPDFAGEHLRYLCGYSYKKYVLVKNFIAENKFKQGNFDNISIDDNGNGFAYTYIAPEEKNILKNDLTIDYIERKNRVFTKRINNLIISDKEEEIETVSDLSPYYIFPGLSLNSSGNGLMSYLENRNRTLYLYAKKINNLIPEKEFKLIRQFNDYDNRSQYYTRVNIDNVGNGYLTYSYNEKVFYEPIKNYEFINDKIEFIRDDPDFLTRHFL